MIKVLITEATSIGFLEHSTAFRWDLAYPHEHSTFCRPYSLWITGKPSIIGLIYLFRLSQLPLHTARHKSRFPGFGTFLRMCSVEACVLSCMVVPADTSPSTELCLPRGALPPPELLWCHGVAAYSASQVVIYYSHLAP